MQGALPGGASLEVDEWGARLSLTGMLLSALELMMPCKAGASPFSVVSATTHPQAMDQRGYEKMRTIHFNFKT